jgi:chitin disaccharide deacetylase
VIIVNADDFGRSRAETDAVVACHKARRITSATAMVFMQDSERAAEDAVGLGIDTGLHLNLSQRFTGARVTDGLRRSHDRIVSFLGSSKYALLVYNPFLRRQFQDVVEAQVEEFARLYGKPPSHIDGHQHLHLCANLLKDKFIPVGSRVRRNFSFWPGDKSALNRYYRRRVDSILARDYLLVDYFFSLEDSLKKGRLERVFSLAETSTVELMTHPVHSSEFQYLMSDTHMDRVSRLERSLPRAPRAAGSGNAC